MIRATAILVVAVLTVTGCSNAHPPAPPSAGWWCIAAADGSTGICRRARAACDAERARLDTNGVKHNACAAQGSAFCFLSAPEGAKKLHCAGSMSVCQKVREASAQGSDLAGKPESDCTEQP